MNIGSWKWKVESWAPKHEHWKSQIELLEIETWKLEIGIRNSNGQALQNKALEIEVLETEHRQLKD